MFLPSVLTGAILMHMIHFLLVLYFVSLQTRHFFKKKKKLPLSIHGFCLEEERCLLGRMSRKPLYFIKSKSSRGTAGRGLLLPISEF